MLTKEELLELILDIESSRAERTVSVNDTDKFCEAVCAFANDMPDSKQNGYLLVGVHDDGRLSGLKATDSLLKNLAAIRSIFQKVMWSWLKLRRRSCLLFGIAAGRGFALVRAGPSQRRRKRIC